MNSEVACSFHGDQVDQPLELLDPSILEGSIIDRFREMVRRFASRLAVQDTETSVTYAQLELLVDRIAHSTILATQNRSGPIALLIPAGVTVPAAMLGVLAAGRAYVALDADAPGERNRVILSEAGACAVISTNDIVRQALAYLPYELSVIDVAALLPQPTSGRPHLAPRPSPSDLAAIYYTSGSSGRPKGIAWNHRCVLHWIRVFADAAQISYADRFVLLFSPSVTASYRSIYSALLNGASLHILPPLSLGLAALSQEIRVRGITIFHSVPTLLRRIAESIDTDGRLESIRLACVHGDRVLWEDVDACRRIFSPHVSVYMPLSSTETGPFIHGFVDDAQRVTASHPPLGRPAQGWDVTIVGDDEKPVHDGESGDIVVTSRFIALGYWRGSALQVDFFPSDPGDPELRSYKTGDRGARRPDGLIEFVGRTDQQIKLSGYRTELGEIETALKSCRGVRDAAVVVRLNESGLPQLLVAYCELQRDITGLLPHHLSGMLAEILPLFMVPKSIKILDTLPRLSNLKIDREELRRRAQLERERTLDAPASPPVATSNKIQDVLLELWRGVLDRQDIGTDDDFFLCGGDSLAAVDLIQRIEKKLQYKLSLTILAEAPTVKQLEVRLKTETLKPGSNMIRSHVGGGQRPLFVVCGVFGHAVGLLPTLRSLGVDQPGYGLQPPGMDWATVDCETLPQIAAHYIGELKTVQSRGPYRLLGASFGGLVVFEMALQLQRMGEPIEYLGIVDSNPPTFLCDYGVDLCPLLKVPRPLEMDWFEALNLRVAETHVRMMRDYLLDIRSHQNVFRGELTYIYCTGNPIVAGKDRRRLWQQFATRFRLLPLPGPHELRSHHAPQQTAFQHLLRASLSGEPQTASDPARVFGRTYRIDYRKRCENIVGSMGDVYRVRQDITLGYVDQVSIDSDTVQLSGWALEHTRQQPAQAVVAFLENKYLGYGSCGSSRPDVAKHLAAASAQYSGFDFHFPRSAVTPGVGNPRLFVLSGDGSAVELQRSIDPSAASSQGSFVRGAGN